MLSAWQELEHVHDRMLNMTIPCSGDESIEELDGSRACRDADKDSLSQVVNREVGKDTRGYPDY
jgi:hypothetical protein